MTEDGLIAGSRSKLKRPGPAAVTVIEIVSRDADGDSSPGPHYGTRSTVRARAS